jgi:hypothetical protein
MPTSYQRTRSPYPMSWVNHREIGPFYEGPVFIWDIDKTYLNTRFSQLKGLLRIPFELGVDKAAYPGVVALLQGLREGPNSDQHCPLYFVSASPRQIRESVERKMLLDGIEFDGLTFKDPLLLFLRGQFSQLTEQIAFKLAALIRLAGDLPNGAQCHLFGDDAEQDALIYCLFGDVIAGRLRGEDLKGSLLALGVRDVYCKKIVEEVAKLPGRELVRSVSIHLVREPDGASIAGFGPHVVGYASAGAVAQDLVERGLLGERSASQVMAGSDSGEVVRGAADADPQGWLTPRSSRSNG